MNEAIKTEAATEDHAKTLPLTVKPDTRCDAERLETTAGQLLDLMKPRKRHHVSVYVHARRDTTAPNYIRDRAIWTLSVAHEPYNGGHRNRTVSTVDIPGWIGTGFKDATVKVPRSGDFGGYVKYSDDPSNLHTPDRGYESLIFDRLYSYLRLVPRKARVSLRINFDNWTQGPIAEAAIHVDGIDLRCEWQTGRTRRQVDFLIDVSAGAHNSARFGVYY